MIVNVYIYIIFILYENIFQMDTTDMTKQDV